MNTTSTLPPFDEVERAVKTGLKFLIEPPPPSTDAIVRALQSFFALRNLNVGVAPLVFAKRSYLLVYSRDPNAELFDDGGSNCASAAKELEEMAISVEAGVASKLKSSHAFSSLRGSLTSAAPGGSIQVHRMTLPNGAHIDGAPKVTATSRRESTDLAGKFFITGADTNSRTITFKPVAGGKEITATVVQNLLSAGELVAIFGRLIAAVESEFVFERTDSGALRVDGIQVVEALRAHFEKNR